MNSRGSWRIYLIRSTKVRTCRLINIWDKTNDLEEEARAHEDDVFTKWPIDLQYLHLKGNGYNYTFSNSNSWALHVHTSKSEKTIDSSFAHHICNNASLFCSLNKDIEEEICALKHYELIVTNPGRIDS